MLEEFREVKRPCYLLKEEVLIKNLEVLKNFRLSAGVEILLALKAFAQFGAFATIRRYLSSATASSLYEAKLCFEEFKSKAHLCCPVYLEEDFEEMQAVSSHITFNSLTQFEQYKDRIQNDIKVALRINPELVLSKYDLYNAGSADSRFGIRADDLPAKLDPAVSGLHVHCLFETRADGLLKLLSTIERKFKTHLQQIEWLNLGGGHLITADNYNQEIASRELRKFSERYNVKIILEPGTAAVWQAGYLISFVRDIIHNGSVPTCMLDVSFTAHMPDCLEMPYKPNILGAKENAKHTYRMGGCTCLAGDVVGNYSFDKPLSIGDMIVFADMQHYTFVKSNMFNGVKHPDLGIMRTDGRIESIKSFSYSDYKNRLG